ncbi:putative divalent cation/proton antiporter TMEM165 isoform X2 [Drosophila sulfurigaster albostrigata]|uniref:putative divalent cation/proton antiporter TMEM165 isoform X2 n=1 Tax=Drosophila sulfurigaster albostrigata TaxID=89887 RepID=UPI002D21BF20|nr:putative divalent cation/proton antiporter TMEM165 isoform X2 [Drosophila sulfurigaster albostrigata]
MSQNQSYFWQTTRHNVYLKRSAKWHMAMALMVVLTFSTICAAEFDNDGDDVANNLPAPQKELEQQQEVINAVTNANIQKSIDIEPEKKQEGNFLDAFTASISVILLTELGDKTFFIAAIMAMRHPRLIVFGGAIAALALMTVLSCVFGMAANFIPKIYTYYISTALFLIFGLKMLYDGYKMKPTDAQEELEEVQSDLRKREDELDRDVNAALVHDPESGRRKMHRSASYFTMRILAQAFTMTFLAEWGDRSQLTTIILAASKDVYGVIVGGILGHCICTGLAVIGGRLVASKISVRTVTIVGGIVFIGFAVYAVLMPPNDL